MTFSPRPEEFFAGALNVARHLFTPAMKNRFFEEFGIDAHVIQSFNAELAQMTHEDFFRQFISGPLKVNSLIIGHDFRFGKNRAGDADHLAMACRMAGVELIVLDPYSEAKSESADSDDHPVSSSRIRTMLAKYGDVAGALKLLGHAFQLEGTVVEGARLGRTIGVPTINLGGVAQIIPARGVYAARVVLSPDLATVRSVPKLAIPAAVNIGIRPTVAEAGLNTAKELVPVVEAHLLTGSYGADELYGKKVSIYFVQRIRDEIKFDGLPALREKIQQDIAAARRLLV